MNHSACWSLEPNASVSGHWLLGSGVRSKEKLNGSILYTRYTDISHKQSVTGYVTTGGSTSNYNVLRPMAQWASAWAGQLLQQQPVLFRISARYDFMYFWDQNVMRSSVTQLQGYEVNPAIWKCTA